MVGPNLDRPEPSASAMSTAPAPSADATAGDVSARETPTPAAIEDSAAAAPAGDIHVQEAGESAPDAVTGVAVSGDDNPVHPPPPPATTAYHLDLRHTAAV